MERLTLGTPGVRLLVCEAMTIVSSFIRRLTSSDQQFLWEMLYQSLHVPEGGAQRMRAMERKIGSLRIGFRVTLGFEPEPRRVDNNRTSPGAGRGTNRPRTL